LLTCAAHFDANFGFLLGPTVLFALYPLDNFVARTGAPLDDDETFFLLPLGDLVFGGATPPLSGDEELSPAAACQAALVGTSSGFFWSR
jgi:hypothetical protein